MNVTDRTTDRQIDHRTVSSIPTGEIAFSDDTIYRAL